MVSIPVWLAWLLFGVVLVILWLDFLLGNFLAYRTARLKLRAERSQREEALVRENRQLQQDAMQWLADLEDAVREKRQDEKTIAELRQIVEELSESPTVSWPSSSISSREA